eukprot:g1947.t1
MVDFSFGHVDNAVLENLLRNTRSGLVRSEFFATPESSYTETNEIRIWACTYNLNGRKPPEDLDFGDLIKKWESSWPTREKVGTGSHRKADLYMLGFQEAVPLNAQNIIAGWTGIPAGWDRSIDRSLNKWKKEEELVHSPEVQKKTGDQILDSYLSQWTGTPAANLQQELNNDNTQRRNDAPTVVLDNQQPLNSSPLKQDALLNSKEITELPVASTEVPVQMESSDSQRPQSPVRKPMDKIKAKVYKTEEDPVEEFVQIISHQLVGLYITGWARKSLLKRITGIQVTTVATGALGYLANKGELDIFILRQFMRGLGAIAARMRIDDSTLVFITSHLASGSHEGDEIRRNLDYKEIIRRTQFPREINLVKVKREDGTLAEDFSSRPEGLPPNPSSEVKRAFVGGNWTGFRVLRDLDNVIWVGDMNYRINGSCQDVIKLIRENKLNALLEVDQLSIEKAAGNTFQGFTESPIDFPPTYKFIRGTNYYTGEIEDESSESSDAEELQGRENARSDLKQILENRPVSSSRVDLGSRKNRHSFSSERKQEIQKRIDQLGISFHGTSLSDIDSDHQLNSFPSRRSSLGDFRAESCEIETKKEAEKKKPVAKKIRTPSWTDRILYYSSKRTLHQLLYGSISSLHVSDHRPVIGAFILETKKFNEELVEAALHEARRVIDLQEMAAIPQCTVSPLYLDIGEVMYRKPLEFSVTVHNTGEVPANYSFIPAMTGRQVARNVFPKWLSVKPTSGVIKSGKKAELEIRVSIQGGKRGSADELFGNLTNTLDHILVLHIEGGSDFFISIVGTYTLSCFGLSLYNLARHLPMNKSQIHKMKSMKQLRLPSLVQRSKEHSFIDWQITPITSLDSDYSSNHALVKDLDIPQQKLNASSSISRTGPQPNLVEGPTGLMIPSQVMRMVRFLAEEDRLKTPRLFTESWNRVKLSFDQGTELESIRRIREVLDRGEELPVDITVHDMAGALLTLFFDLPSPMIPESITHTCEKSDVSCLLAISLVEEAMSAIEWSVFDTVMELMRTALLEENTKSNQLTIRELSETLSEAFFQYLNEPTKSFQHKDVRPEMTPRKKVLIERRCMFVEHSLELESSSLMQFDTKESTDKTETLL